MFREKPVDDNKAASKIAVTSSLRSFPSVPYLSRLICSPEAKRIRPRDLLINGIRKKLFPLGDDVTALLGARRRQKSEPNAEPIRSSVTAAVDSNFSAAVAAVRFSA